VIPSETQSVLRNRTPEMESHPQSVRSQAIQWVTAEWEHVSFALVPGSVRVMVHELGLMLKQEREWELE